MNKVILKKYDYYPFGMLVPNRNYSSPEYRYGFNGMEADDEIEGSKNSYTTSFRHYDPRVGRWISLDPESTSFPHLSPYNAYANNPIIFVDKNGRKFVIPENLSKSEKLLIQFALEIFKAAAPKVFKELDDHETLINFMFEDLPDSAPDKFSKGETRLTWITSGGLTATVVEKKLSSGGTSKNLNFEARLDNVMKKTGLPEYEKMWDEYYDDPKKSHTDLVQINQEIAEKFVSIENNEINIALDVKLKNDFEDLAKTLGHENGHAFYDLFNKTLSNFSQLLNPDEKGGHNTNEKNSETNPSGKKAFLLQKKVEVFKNLKPDEYKAIDLLI